MACETGCGPGGSGVDIPQPSGAVSISAVGTAGGIDLFWAMPLSNPHAVAYATIYRGITDVMANAIPLVVLCGTRYRDFVTDGVTYYYWVKFTSYSGVTGAPAGPTNAAGLPITDSVLDVLEGTIGLSALTLPLQAQINAIATLASGLAAEALERAEDDDGLSAAIAAINASESSLVNAILAESTERGLAITALNDEMSGLSSALVGVSASFTAQYNAYELITGFDQLPGGIDLLPAFDAASFKVGSTAINQVAPFQVVSGVVELKESMLSAGATSTVGLTEFLTVTSVAAGASEILGTTSLTMPASSTGVPITGQVSYTPAADAVHTLEVIRDEDSVVIGSVTHSSRSGWPEALLVMAYDPAPIVGSNTYSLVLSNPATGTGSMVACTVETAALMAVGLKR